MHNRTNSYSRQLGVEILRHVARAVLTEKVVLDNAISANLVGKYSVGLSSVIISFAMIILGVFDVGDLPLYF